MMNEGRGNIWMLPQDEELKISSLSRLFDKMSESYKLFWFQAIVSSVCDGYDVVTYDELIDKMIADAWYMVSEYRLNLGPSDTLEKLIHYIHNTGDLKSSEKRENILAYLKRSDDKELKNRKKTLTLNVPYRLQAPFLSEIKGKDWNVTRVQLAERINLGQRLIYYFEEVRGLQSRIRISEPWCRYIRRNQRILQGWIQYNMITYLQKRNPNVPGIVNKLAPPQERKLDIVRKYWKLIADITPVRDIYTRSILKPQDISIDHFVPWSYVAHDELWNLSPTTKSANSSKSNSLPRWDKYFPLLCDIEYQSYQAVWQDDTVHAVFDRCRREHINSEEIQLRLYRKGLDFQAFSRELEEIMLPVYQSAKNMGFELWEYSG